MMAQTTAGDYSAGTAALTQVSEEIAKYVPIVVKLCYAIAGVVAMRPDCLILDEATAMLDPRGREQVMQTIHYLNRNMGITVVSITHYMEEAAQADRVLVMSKGHVVMEGTPKEVFSQTEKVRALHLDVPQAAELRDELVKAGIPMPEGIIDTGECAQALYELLQ
jgi:energy-coupling factor transport system ATP-binding protein